MMSRKKGKGGKAGQRRLGFLTGQLKVPADFDRMGSEQIEECFAMLQGSEPTKSLEEIEEAIRAGWAGEANNK